jgi:ATP-binding cassette subfamily B protein
VLTLLSRWLGAVGERHAKVWHEHFDRFGAEVTQGLRGMVMVTALGTSETELAGRRRTVSDLSESGRRLSWRVGAWGIAQSTVAAGAGISVLIVGGREVSRGSLTIGSLLSFYAIAALLLRSVSSVVGTLPSLVTGGASLRRIQQILDADARQPYRGTRRIDFTGDVRLEGVSFGYTETPLLHELDLVVRPGERVALVGPNGAGKSTVTALILGLYRPQQGSIFADGVPYDELDLAHLRSHIGLVLQELFLVNGTVAEAIRHGREATSGQVELAALRAGAHEVVAELAGGYDAQIGEDGSLLSGGQRQRIALARALLGEPRLVALDEPTTHLDDAAIAHLLSSLSELPWRPSVLVVTHDPAAAAFADRVVMLRDGYAVTEVPEL